MNPNNWELKCAAPNMLVLRFFVDEMNASVDASNPADYGDRASTAGDSHLHVLALVAGAPRPPLPAVAAAQPRGS